MSQLRQGVTPRTLALSCALGAALGIFPVLGTTTLLCFLAALVFKLNQPAIQAVNYFIYPLQLVFIPMFVRLGEIMTGSPHVPFYPPQVFRVFMESPGTFLAAYGMAAVYAVVAWFLISFPAVWIGWIVLWRLFSWAAKQHVQNRLRGAGR